MGVSKRKAFEGMGSAYLILPCGVAVNASPQFFMYQSSPEYYNLQDQTVHKIPFSNAQPLGGSANKLQPILATSPYENPPALPSGTLVWQIRQLTEYVKLALRQLAQDPIASPYISRVISASECLTNVEDAIVSIDTSVRLLENTEQEVLTLENTFKAMQTSTDTERIVRVSADIVRQLSKLVPKLSSNNAQTCVTRPQVSFSVIKLVAELLEDVSEDNKIWLSVSGRNDLKNSANVAKSVVNFVEQVGVTSNGSNKKTCLAGRKSNSDAISSIGDMLQSLGDLLKSFGGLEEAEDIGSRTAWLKGVVGAINNSNLVAVDCTGPEDTYAETLEDIADLIAEVGIEQLSKQLGFQKRI